MIDPIEFIVLICSSPLLPQAQARGLPREGHRTIVSSPRRGPSPRATDGVSPYLTHRHEGETPLSRTMRASPPRLSTTRPFPHSTTPGPSGLDGVSPYLVSHRFAVKSLPTSHIVTAVGRDSVRAHSCPRPRITRGLPREGHRTIVTTPALHDAAYCPLMDLGPVRARRSLSLPHIVTAVGRDSVRAHSCPRPRITRGLPREGHRTIVTTPALHDAAYCPLMDLGPVRARRSLSLPHIVTAVGRNSVEPTPAPGSG
jgi:hypothetical protein